MSATELNEGPRFTKTDHDNIIRYAKTGVYYLHCKIQGRSYQESLETDDINVAINRRDERKAQIQAALGRSGPKAGGVLSFEEALTVYEADLDRRVQLVGRGGDESSTPSASRSSSSTRRSSWRRRSSKSTWTNSRRG